MTTFGQTSRLMTRTKTRFLCSACGATATKWMGRCPQCQEWNTLAEELIPERTSAFTEKKEAEKAIPVLLDEISTNGEMRITVRDPELSRVLGGGVVLGSVILMAGEPGAGKSTLLLQLAQDPALHMLYITGEESASQIKMRAERLGIRSRNCHIMMETNIHHIIEAIRKTGAGVIVIDSIQTLYTPDLESVPGTVGQIRECSYQLQQLSKETGYTIFLVGHINKEGDIAGPKLMEHIVDVVLQLEGDRQYHFRLLRCVKNRFGSTREIGIYEMKGAGLIPVENPSAWLIPADHIQRTSGTAIALVMEGYRPFLIETQALVSTAVYGTAQRSSTGYDIRKLHLMLAVLEKRCGFFFGNQDVFVNVAGGLRVTEPAIDLALAVALVSSLQDIPVPRNVCFTGEVGLSGEIRQVQQIEKRVAEAARLGYKKIYIPAGSQIEKESKNAIVEEVQLLVGLFEKVFA